MRQGCGTLAGRPTPPDNRIPRENNSRRALCLPGVFCWVGLVQNRGRAAGRPPPTAAGKRASPVSAVLPHRRACGPHSRCLPPGFRGLLRACGFFSRGSRPATRPQRPQNTGPCPPQAARRPRRRANGLRPFRRRSRRACGPHSRCLSPGFRGLLRACGFFSRGLRPAARPQRPQNTGPCPPQAPASRRDTARRAGRRRRP